MKIKYVSSDPLSQISYPRPNSAKKNAEFREALIIGYQIDFTLLTSFLSQIFYTSVDLIFESASHFRSNVPEKAKKPEKLS